MSILITVIVDSISSVISSYDSIKFYRCSYEDGVFSEISDVSTRPSLSASAKYYTFVDENGTSSSYYKTSYYNSSSLVESSLSTASHGIEVEQQFVMSSYPAEIVLTSSDEYNVNRIRYLIGDEKKVKRDYVSPSCLGSYENVSLDLYSYELQEKGWPLRVVKDSVEYVSSSNPYVTDYKYLTFSGTIISTTSGVVDVWYDSFRHSDREILGVFNTEPLPAGTTSSTVTAEMYRLSTAVRILESEIVKLMGETSGQFNLQGELSFNPEPLLRQKREFVKQLKDKLDELVTDVNIGNFTGVRID